MCEAKIRTGPTERELVELHGMSKAEVAARLYIREGAARARTLKVGMLAILLGVNV